MAEKLSIADLAAAIKRRDPRLANVDDATLIRKVLERRPEVLKLMETSEPRRPLDLYGKIGARLKSDLNVPQQLQGAANAIHAGLVNIREHGPSQMPAFLQALKQYGHPENVIGDLLAAGILGKMGGGDSPAAQVEPRAPLRTTPTMESFMDTMTRRGPGAPPEKPAMGLEQQYRMVEELKQRYAQQRASGHPDVFRTSSQLRQAMDQLEELEKAKWGKGYESSPKNVSSQGGGGANYSADDLAAFKKKWGIQ